MAISGSLHAGGGSPIWAVISVALSVSLSGTIGTTAQLGPDSLSTMSMASWRGVIGGAGLVVVTLIRGQALWRYPMQVKWMAMGVLGMVSIQLGFFEAVARTGVVAGTLLVIGVGPVAAGIIDWLAYRHRPSRRWLCGVVLALCGVVLLSGGVALFSGGSSEVVWSGVVFGIVAGCGIPCQGFAVQQLMRDRPPISAVATLVASGSVILLPIALMSADTAFASSASVLTVVYLGLVTVTVAYTLWGIGLKYLRLGVAVVVGLLEPAVAAVLAVAVLDETVTMDLVIGVCLVLAGVAVTSSNLVADSTVN